MASSLGYALMSWSAEFARHSKAKKGRKRDLKKGRKQSNTKPSSSSAISEFEYCATTASSTKVELQSTDVQTDETFCDRCQQLCEEVDHLEQQLSDVNFVHDDLKKKLSTAKSTLVTAIESESHLRGLKENLELDEAQLRYEFDQVKADLLKQLNEKDRVHQEQIRAIERATNERECEWANKNEVLQKELRQTLSTALQENEKDDLSLSSLEKEIMSLQTVIEMRGSENRQLREENNVLKNKLENHHWLEAELGKAKHRLEELAVIVQNKMVSEKELLELSEALQRDLVRSRAETLHFKQQVENQKYTEKHLLKVQHSQSDLYNNTVNNMVDNYLSEKKLSSLQQIKNWSDHSNDEQKPIPDHRNQHQKASCGKTPNLVLDVREKNESVSWMIQMQPSATCSPTLNKRKRI